MLKKNFFLYLIALLMIPINISADESIDSSEPILMAKSNIEEITVI